MAPPGCLATAAGMARSPAPGAGRALTDASLGAPLSRVPTPFVGAALTGFAGAAAGSGFFTGALATTFAVLLTRFASDFPAGALRAAAFSGVPDRLLDLSAGFFD